MIELLGMRLATFTELARELGVKTNQVFMWHQRRERNGFPDSVVHAKARNGLNAPHFDIDEVLDWRRTYIPPKGGYRAHKTRRPS